MERVGAGQDHVETRKRVVSKVSAARGVEIPEEKQREGEREREKRRRRRKEKRREREREKRSLKA